MKRLLNQKIRPANPNHEWLEKNYPGFLHVIFMQGIQAGVYEMNKLYPFGFRSGYTILSDSMMDWFWDARELRRVREILLKKNKRSLNFFMKIYKRWEKDHKINIAAYARAEKINFKKLTDKELFNEYEHLYQVNIKQGATGYLADCFLSAGEKDWLSEFIISHLPKTQEAERAIAVLTAPVIPTYSNEAAMTLTKIGRDIRGEWKNINDFLRFARKNKKLWQKLEAHTRRFYWLENNYFPKILRADNFARQLYNETKEKEKDYTRVLAANKQKKSKLLGILKDEYLSNVITMSELMTHMQDYRKMAMVRFAHFCHLFFKEMARRTGLTLVDFHNTVEPEIKDIFLERKINRQKLRCRAEKSFAYGNPNGYVVYEGDDYKKYVDESNFIQKYSSIYEIIGVSASPGMVQGVVRLIKDAKNGKALKRGDILVTNNTTPEFVPLMKRAGAIITEQGGITTHAAIVSRELGIPCVIGTKIATKVLKDGQLVEVDANKGTVKILK